MPTTAPLVNTEIKSVLLATDLSTASEKPLRHALSIVRHFNAKFYLTHVVTSLGYTLAGAEALELASEAATREVQALKQQLLLNGSLAGLEHEFIVSRGDVWKQVQALISEKKIDLVVVGTHGRRNLGKMLLGSQAEQIFRQAGCLVLTVGPHSFADAPLDVRPFRSILFATDFGPASLQALPYAITYANHFGVKLVLLHVAPVAPLPEGFHWSSTTNDVGIMQDNFRGPAEKKLKDLLSGQAPLNVPPEFLVKFGNPGNMILRVANALQADLLVMGLNRSRHIETASHMPWATAYELVCKASCPVLTVKA